MERYKVTADQAFRMLVRVGNDNNTTLRAACPREPQAALVHISTPVLQDVLAEPQSAELLTDSRLSRPTPRVRKHVLAHGEVELDVTTRLDIRTDARIGRR